VDFEFTILETEPLKIYALHNPELLIGNNNNNNKERPKF